MRGAAPIAAYVAEFADRQIRVDVGPMEHVAAEMLEQLVAELPVGHAVVVHGVDDPDTHSAALHLAAALTTSMIIEPGEKGPVAYLEKPKLAAIPEPLPEPDRPENLPESFPIEKPLGLGNCYGHRVESARMRPMPEVAIAVVIPVYNRRVALLRTLEALTHQTYRLDRIEVVIADDGSHEDYDDVAESYAATFGSVRCVKQEDLGYRLSEVRNLGIDACDSDHVILLDCDMAPVPRLVELFARHLAVEPNAIYCGHRRYVDANNIDPRDLSTTIAPLLSLPDIRPNNAMVTTDEDGPTVDWRIPLYQRTESLQFADYPFLAVCGGNIGFTKDTFAAAGPFDTDFTAWGGEDAEWAYRAWNRGIYIVPLLDACGLHQEPPGGRNETDREAGRAETRPLLVDKVPVRFRSDGSGSGYSIPLVSIYIPAFNAEATIVDAITSALKQSVTDLEVCVVDDGSSDQTVEVVRRRFGNSPRVRLLEQGHGGIGRTSDTAVRMCRAPFIGQLDADDLLKKHAVRRALAVLQADDRIGVAYSSMEVIDGNGDVIGDFVARPTFNRSELLFHMMVHHFRLFRARDFYRTSGFAGDLVNAVDYDLYLKLSEVTEFVHLPVPTYRYRQHAASTSQTRAEVQRANHRLALGRALRRRGIAEEWEIFQKNPMDVREVDFVPSARPGTHFGACFDAVRIRATVQDGNEGIGTLLEQIYPSWTRTNGSQRTALLSPEISHARAVHILDRLGRRAPAVSAEIVFP